MRKTMLAVVLGVCLGGLVGVEWVHAQSAQPAGKSYRNDTSSYRPIQARRTIARPERGARRVQAPRGALLVRGRYWNPALRWKTDRYTRSVYAVYRGEVWFLDPSSGWAYTIDRYGRVYTCDPRYRAVYSLGPVAAWRGEIPYFFGYFAPDNGYYALPRYRSFVSYYDSPRYDDYRYDAAYDYWWNNYDDYFYSRRFTPVVTFSFFDVRTVRYDRYYTRDVYLDRRGRQYVEPAPQRGRGVPGSGLANVRGDGRDGRGQPNGRNGVPGGAPAERFARREDASLPEIASVPGFETPSPDVAVQMIDRQPAMPEVQIAPAVAVNVAEVVAVNPEVLAPVPTATQMATIEQARPIDDVQPASSFDSMQTLDNTVTPEILAPVAADPSFDPTVGMDQQIPERVAPTITEVPLQSAAPDVLDTPAVVPAAVVEPTALTPEFSPAVPEVTEQPVFVEPAAEPAYTAPEPSYVEPQPVNSAPESSYAEPESAYSEPAYTEPERSFAEPEPVLAPEPTYSEPEPAYSAPEPSFAEPEPVLAPEPTYSEPEPAYSAPEPTYTEPEPAYSEPEPSFSEPEPTYSAPEPSYSEPEPTYSAPEPSYSEPEPTYSAPEPSYSEPEPAYSAPEPSYSEPEPAYSAPEPSYSEPEPTYSAPEPAPEPEPEPNYSSDEEQPQR